MKNSPIGYGITILLMSTFIICPLFAKDEPEASKQLSAKEKSGSETPVEYPVTVETVSGEVSAIDKNYISIVYDRDYDSGTEYEILIPFDSKTAVKHKTKIADIKKGDLVSVEYEKPVEAKDGKLKAKSVNFIQSGVGELVSDTVDGLAGGSTQ